MNTFRFLASTGTLKVSFDLCIYISSRSHMDGVSSLLKRSLEEGHHISLVLSELDKLGLQLIVSLLKPPERKC